MYNTSVLITSVPLYAVWWASLWYMCVCVYRMGISMLLVNPHVRVPRFKSYFCSQSQPPTKTDPRRERQWLKQLDFLPLVWET